MPSGIILSSGSVGATQEAISDVLKKHGYEPEEAEQKQEEAVEPKREDFESDEDFEAAQQEFESAQDAREETEDEEEEPKPKLSRRQKAIEKATAPLKEQLDKLTKELEAVKGAKKPEAEPEELKAPKREDFKSDEEFDEAKFQYRYKLQRQKEQTEEQKKVREDAVKRVKEEREEHWTKYKENVQKFAAKTKDFAEVVNDSVEISEAVYEAIVRLEDPRVTYYLGKNPAEAKRLSQLEPYTAVVEVGRLAERLKTGTRSESSAADGGTKKKTAPKLPEPVRPVSTSATSSTLNSREAAKTRDYKAFKAAQRRGV